MNEPISKSRYAKMVHCGCCSSCSFECGLRWASCRDFTRTQWHIPQWLFLLYRTIAVLYTCGFQIYFWVVHFQPDTYAFVTNWTYLVLTLYVLVAAANLIADVILDANGSPVYESATLSLRYMVQWVLYDVIVTWSLIVAIVYWGILYQQHDDIVGWINDISNHLLPAVFGLMEVAITATPCLFNHVVYPITYGILYLTFTLIYWTTGNGTVYYFLDYGDNPVYAIVVLLCLFVANFVIHTMVWALTKLRQWLARKTNGCRCGHRRKFEIEGNLPNQRVTSSEPVEGNSTYIL